MRLDDAREGTRRVGTRDRCEPGPRPLGRDRAAIAASTSPTVARGTSRIGAAVTG